MLFAFNHSYWERPNRPVLSQMFEDSPGRLLWRGSQGNLPAWFDNLEPEGALLRALAAWRCESPRG